MRENEQKERQRSDSREFKEEERMSQSIRMEEKSRKLCGEKEGEKRTTVLNEVTLCEGEMERTL